VFGEVDVREHSQVILDDTEMGGLRKMTLLIILEIADVIIKNLLLVGYDMGTGCREL
jgi:hypothetical protein